MTDTELIIAQAKQIAEQNTLLDYYRKHSESLEAALRLQANTTESNDDIPLTMEGLKNECDMTTVGGSANA